MMNTVSNNLLGIYATVPELLKERNEVQGFYNFYEGPAANDMAVLLNKYTRGQSWMINTDLDYKPSRDIRNHTQKLMLKQKRFMFGASPSILLKPMDKKDKDAAEGKRTLLDSILDDNNFWSSTAKAFMDATIGKRVLLLADVNPGEPIRLKYFTMQEFTFEVDPEDCNKLISVIIAYMDADTANKPADRQIWHRWKYYMSGATCRCTKGIYNGSAEPIEEELDFDTFLDELPCRVIFNGGLTGDIEGVSDIKPLIDMQNAYNKTMSDFRDALRFKMFEQPVFINADSTSLENIKIAPNAMIDLQGDPSLGSGDAAVTPDAKMLSSSFSFKEAADSYLDRTIKDMYEIMDQPRPEQLANVPSAKALKFLYYDLMGRCEEKWLDWEPAIKWLIEFMFKSIKLFKLYSDDENSKYVDVKTNMVIEHNYPIPEDEKEKKDIAMAEVEKMVRSHKSYVRDFSDIEDEDGEWEEILKEQAELNGSMTDQFSSTVNNDIKTNPDGLNPDGSVIDNGGTAGA